MSIIKGSEQQSDQTKYFLKKKKLCKIFLLEGEKIFYQILWTSFFVQIFCKLYEMIIKD